MTPVPRAARAGGRRRSAQEIECMVERDFDYRQTVSRYRRVQIEPRQ